MPRAVDVAAGSMTALLVDGLGHGPEAAAAAQRQSRIIPRRAAPILRSSCSERCTLRLHRRHEAPRCR